MIKKLLLLLLVTFFSFAAPVTIGGFTVFESASTGSAIELKTFLDKGVDVNIKDEDGESLLYYACVGRKLENTTVVVKNNFKLN